MVKLIAPLMIRAFITAIPLAVSVLIFVGCSKSGSEMSAKDYEAEEIRLFQVYLNSDATQARQSLEDSAKLIDHTPQEELNRLIPSGTAGRRVSVYGRMYLLDTAIHRPDSANADLVKMRYWYLQEQELGGYVLPSANQLDRAVADRLNTLQALDKNATGGRGPAYLIGLPTSRPAATEPSK